MHGKPLLMLAPSDRCVRIMRAVELDQWDRVQVEIAKARLAGIAQGIIHPLSHCSLVDPPLAGEAGRST